MTSASDLVAGQVYVIAEISDNTTKYLVTGYGSKLTNTTSGFTVSSNTITTSTATPLEFTLGTVTSGNNTYYTLQYGGKNYLGYGSSANFETATATTNTKEQWSITPSSSAYKILNVNTSTRYIGRNGSNIGPYSTSNSYPNCYLFKKQASIVSSLTIGTAPTKLNYKVGEKLDLTGLVLNADGNNVTSGYTSKIGETTVTSGTTTLNDVGAKTITFTYGGQTATQTIHVGALTGIEITTEPDKTEYNEGQTFDPTGMVVTATFSDGEETPTQWTEDVTAACTFSPDTETDLDTGDDKITVSYTWGGVNKTADQDITVTAGVPYTVTFNAGSGSCGTSSLTEASFAAGVTLPTATIGVTGWSFAGWATASTTNTETAPTLYAAESTYKPSSNITLYAVYKFLEGTEGEYIRATSLADVKAASKVILVNGGKTLTTDLSAKDALTESSSKVTAADKTVFTMSGNDTDGYILSGASGKLGASSLPTSNGNYEDIAITNSNSTWSIADNTNTPNTFTFLNKSGTNTGLEYYSSGSKWVVYRTNSPTSSSYYATKVYIPNFSVVYNSNPAAIVNPTIAWTTSGNKSLYVQDEATYDNAANVTGISKTPVYTSSDATVATVSSAGVVTALKAGSTTITAKVAKEVGVNSEASVNYTVTVKDAKTIAGLKAITDASSVVTFTADLTDAVITYVNGSHAYIQDASGAVYASCGTSLTAGKKINGAVSGSIKAAYKIDEITAINLEEATITDGDIPAALTKTVAQLIASGTSLEGQLVQVSGATVTASLEGTSGGKITDDAKVSEINLYAPASNIEALKDAEGTFKGYISYYNASTYRLNIYDQSQITLTKNAPTDQSLTFESDAVELDEDTDDYNDFTGQAVSGAQGTVTYSIDSDDDGVVTSINSGTGAVVLSGEYGTATIKASAAAKEVTEAGVTTPYKVTTKTYTITVYPRYTSTFNINGDETVLRQATHGASIVVPTPAATIGDYSFIGWSTSTVATTNVAPETVTPPTTPESSVTYYAVYALEREGGEEEVTSTLNLQQSEPADSKSTVNGVAWSWSNVTFSSTGNTGMEKNKSASVTFVLPENAVKAKSIALTCPTGMSWGGNAAVVLKAGSSELASMKKDGSYTFTNSDNTEGTYTMSQTSGANAWINAFVLTYTALGIENYGYCTTLPVVSVTIPASTYAARCYDRALDYRSAGITVYTAKLNTTTHAVTLTKVASGKVPANEGVIIHADAGTYAVPVAASADALSNNEMVGVTARTLVKKTTDDTYYNYILQTEDGDPVFNMATEDGAYLPANRAYLHTQYDASASLGRLSIVFDDDQTTTIQGVTVCNQDKGVYYNLKGQRVENPKKGELYIVGGKKVIFK